MYHNVIATEKHTHDVVLQVLAHTGKIQLYVNAGSNQGILWSDPTLHQDVGASDRTGGQHNLLANVDGGDGAALGLGKLHTGGIEVSIKKEFGDGEAGQDVEIRARRQGVDVGSAGVGAGPVGGVDSRGGDERSIGLAPRRIRTLGNPDGLEGRHPFAHDRKNTKNRMAVSARARL